MPRIARPLRFLTVSSRSFCLSVVVPRASALVSAVPPSAVVVMTITRHHIMVIMVHRLFADYVATFVRIDVAVVMIVVDHVRVAIMIDMGNPILVVVVSACGHTSQNERADCEETE